MGRAAYWAVPSLISLALYWPGLLAWFQKDDFAWLGLRDLVHSWRDLLWALFAPLAQGTIRTLSERVFFLSFTSLFGLHALPYRLWVFATGCLTLAMLCAVCTKLTRSRAAGFLAAVFWICNGTVAYVYSWTAIYYELLCSLFLLTGLWLVIRHAETGEKRYWAAQWVTYLIGFLVLELNVVYPALVLMYALCFAPGIVRKVLPLFVPAAAYTVLHLVTTPLQTSGPYKMYWNASVLPTFWTYWKYALGPNRLIYAGIQPSVFRSALALGLMAGLVGFLCWSVYRRQWLTVFCAAWFVIVLAPVLPLRDHITDYYLTIPTIGLAMWGSWAVVCGWRAGLVERVAAVVLATIYLGVNIPVAHITSRAFADSSHRIHSLVSGVVEATENQPGKVVLLSGIGRELFWDSVWNRPFRLVNRHEVYLIREDNPEIVPLLPPEDVPHFFMDRKDAVRALAEGRAVLFAVEGGARVRDVTREYLASSRP